MRNVFGRAALVVALSLSFASAARADLFLAGDIAGLPGFCASDNNLVNCAYGTVLVDDDPTLGTLAITTALVGGLTVNGSLHESVFGPPTNVLDSSSLTIVNPLGGIGTVDVLASVGATNFVGPVSQASTTGSGTWGLASQGSTAVYTYYLDALNAQGAQAGTDRPGLLLDAFFDAADAPIDSFSHNGGPFDLAGTGALFSMTLGFDLHLVDGGSLINRGQAEIASAEVPEPMSMLLLGTGLLVGGLLRQRLF